MPNAKNALCIAALCAYPVTVHIAVMLHRPAWGVAGLAAACAACAIQSADPHGGKKRGRVILLLLAVAGALVAYGIVGLPAASEWLLYLSPVFISLALMGLFGASLRPGREPLITGFCRLERGEVPRGLYVYTRRLTWLWTGFFGMMALESLWLALYAPLEMWSLFTNIINYLIIAVLIVAEFIYRTLRYRNYTHASFLQFIYRLLGTNLKDLSRPKEH